MIIKVIATLFVVFALSRAVLRYRDGSIGIIGTVLWSLLWAGVLTIFWWPDLSGFLARLVGVGRGADALIYISILVIFYGLFRLYIKLEFIEHEITSLVRNLALRNPRAPGDQNRTAPDA